MKTAKGLCEYCSAQLGKPYWWGCFGQRADAGLLAQKRRQYPEQYLAEDFESQFGQRVHDCVGLIKGYRWSENPAAPPRYRSSEDVAVRGLYNECRRCGDISALPEEPGTCLFTANLGHVGVYMGGGRIIEAMGHKYGVRESRLSERNFTLWGQPYWLSYGGAGAFSRPSYYYNYRLPLLKEGMEDPHVRSLRRLLGLPAGDKFDSELGEKVIKFQRLAGLLPDGEAGIDTWTALLRPGED